MALKTVDLKPRVGSEIKTDVKTLLSGEVSAEIRNLLVQRGVVIVRGIQMDDAQQRAFTKTLGDLRLGTVKKEGDEGLMKVTIDKMENPEYAEFFAGTFFWHWDGPYDAIPPFATVLTPRVLAHTGGQTEFANIYAAYDDLPESEKKSLEKLQVVHTLFANMVPAVPDATDEQVSLWRSYPTRVHPLVWCHKSGRKSIVLGSSASHIVGMHRVLPYDVESGRRLHRFTLNGEEAVVGV